MIIEHNPGGCECVSCGAIFIGQPADHLCNACKEPEQESLVVRLRKRAAIRRQIPSRKSVMENKPDRIADVLEEAADEIEFKSWVIEDILNDLEYYKDQLKRL